MLGVQLNAVTRLLFAAAVLERAAQMEGRDNVVLAGQFHFNFS